MYKSVFIDHRNGGYQIQAGNTEILDEIINKWDNEGYEFVSITPCPYLTSAERCSFVLVFKSK